MSTTADIAHSLQNIFELFVRIGYVSAESLKLAPHHDDDLEIDYLRQHGANDIAIGFIKSIPWLVGPSVELITASEMTNWQQDAHLESSRELAAVDEGDSFWNDREIDGSWLSLTRGISVDDAQGRGDLLVIDASNGTIRCWDGVYPETLQGVMPQPACHVLDRIYQRYDSLNQIPYKSIIFKAITAVPHYPADKFARAIVEQNARHTNAYRLLHLAALIAGWPNPTFSIADFEAKSAEYISEYVRFPFPGYTYIGRARGKMRLINSIETSTEEDEAIAERSDQNFGNSLGAGVQQHHTI